MRYVIFIAVLLALTPAASACDICGCSMGGNYLGILPQYQRHFIGLRWSEQYSHAAHTRLQAQQGLYASDDRFRTVDLVGRFFLNNRIQLMAMAPYQDFRRMDEGKLIESRGIGDVSVNANYIFWNTGDSMSHRWRHFFSAGGGVKLPTGKYHLTDSEGELLHENLQPGSGSFDFMLQLAYTIRHGQWGLSSDAQARLNTANKNGYYHGNRISAASKLFYQKDFSGWSILPNTGVFMDASEPSANKNSSAEGTGGMALMTTFGVDVYRGKCSFGYTYQLPVYQNLGAGKVSLQNRWMATFNYIF